MRSVAYSGFLGMFATTEEHTFAFCCFIDDGRKAGSRMAAITKRLLGTFPTSTPEILSPLFDIHG